ncbi:hemin-degrading factor [Chitinibacter fontanus]|uniref:Hemin-degrading factor n=1 Tax=Chitinibacter fontanus TaxID=1737446 RepID=A0A7D5VC18_9NEIS|nr:ChuX/HutX family heme-like substrate-binding protein [Chitinibacter fontanus]QLI82593.1 hemin-degrading factor [Chitinibacter fontanus]
MNAINFTEQQHTLQAAYAALREQAPQLRAREIARRLNVSEAELVAAQCGVKSVALQGTPQHLFRGLPAFGRVMVLTRNDWCVHERHGYYEQVEAEKAIGLVLGKDIDLRLFFNYWHSAFAVEEGDRRSIQFFAADGVAVHKVYLTASSNQSHWEQYLAENRADGIKPLIVNPYPPESADRHTADPQALRADWLALTDTHGFFPMLKRNKLQRLGALEAAGADLAQQVASGAVEIMLESAVAQQLPMMCFVGSRGVVQIHSGPIQKLLRTGPWFNVLDPDFNLHLDTTAVASSWVVNKPTSDGWVTSLELYAANDELIVQFFGVRKPGQPEDKAWRALMCSLCARPLAQ